MRTYRLQRPGSIDHLVMREEDVVRPGPGEVLVQVKATSLNFRDLMIVLGQFPLAVRPDVVPLSDASGVVVEVGEGVAAPQVGDRVVSAFYPAWQGGPLMPGQPTYGADRDGWLAEMKVVPADAVLPIPEALSFGEAACLPCAAVTAWTALAGVGTGDTVLTQGSGGVSVHAIQLAKARGASVIATTSSGPERLTPLGCDAVINYQRQPDWGQAVRSATKGRGVDRVVDVGGPGTLGQSLQALAYGGQIAMVGMLAALGGAPPLDVMQVFLQQATLRCVSVGSRADLAAVLRAIEVSKILPVIDSTFPFSEAKAALAHYARRSVFGKVVVRH